MEHIWQQGTADNRRRWFKTLEMYAQKGRLTCSPVHITAYWLRERARLFLKHRHGCQAIKCTPQSIYHISARHTPVHRSTPTVGRWPPGVFQLLNRSSCSYSGCPSTTLCLFVSCKKGDPFWEWIGFQTKRARPSPNLERVVTSSWNSCARWGLGCPVLLLCTSKHPLRHWWDKQTKTTTLSCYPVIKDAFLGMLSALIGCVLGASDLIELHISGWMAAHSCLCILRFSLQSLYFPTPVCWTLPCSCNLFICKYSRMFSSHYQLV